MELLEKDLTEKIIAACLEVSNELGVGFLESVYERALLIALTDKGLKAETQVPLKVVFRNRVVGDFILRSNGEFRLAAFVRYSACR